MQPAKAGPASAEPAPAGLPRPAAPSRAARRRGIAWLGAFVLAVGALSLLAARGAGRPVPVGAPAPAFALPDLGGRMVSLRAYRGRDLVLRFGSVACTVCDPDWSLLAAWQRAAGGGLRLVAVEVGEPLSLVQMDLAGMRLPVPVLVDATGGVAASYGVRSLPSFAFVDRRGVLVAVAPVVTRTGLWPAATWNRYLGLLRAADQRGA